MERVPIRCKGLPSMAIENVPIDLAFAPNWTFGATCWLSSILLACVSRYFAIKLWSSVVFQNYDSHLVDNTQIVVTFNNYDLTTSSNNKICQYKHGQQ